MSTTESTRLETSSEIESYCRAVAENAKQASRLTAMIPSETKNLWLNESAKQLRLHTDEILSANQLDIDRSDEFGLTEAQIDRLKLSPERIDAIALALEEIAAMDDPIGKELDSLVRPNGLKIRKVRAPLGVVFFIYESRPNVTIDAAAICVKSGNAVILRGGKEAAHSSNALLNVMLDAGRVFGIPEHSVQLVQIADREAVKHFLAMNDNIDLAIPRGGEGLIRHVAEHAAMPVLKHYTGNCHVFVDATADFEKAEKIIINAKCQRPGVCNACESLVIHEDIAENFVPKICQSLAEQGVEIVGDEKVCSLFDAATLATDDDYSTEYLTLKISIRTVSDLDAAITHINSHSSGHTEAIITEDQESANRFTAMIDSSAVMVNASTRFNDGGEFGIGAEIGISTDKVHARGPCGVNELTIYKYVVEGDGQIRT